MRPQLEYLDKKSHTEKSQSRMKAYQRIWEQEAGKKQENETLKEEKGGRPDEF